MPVPVPRSARRNHTSRKRAIVAGAVGLASLSAISGASAQLSGSVSVVSDYRYRGISLSDSGPAGQLGLVYDAPQGWYAGTFVSTVKLETYETRGVQAIAFGGYAWRGSSGLSFEAGADYAVVTASPRYDYGEVYVGFAVENVSGRLYFSPRYFGQDASAVYGELNVAPPLLENVRLLAHIGALGGAANKYYRNPPGPLLDGALGVAIDWRGFSLQASWVGVNHSSGAYATNGIERRSGVVASITRSF